MNEFRKTPVGFIPQQDAGYLITISQLPPAASLARTDAVNRRAVELALEVPGVAHAVNLVGFSGATRTNASNAGAVFVTLKPFEERAKDPAQSAEAIQKALLGKFSTIKEALVLVVAPPPVRGIGSAGGFRMMVQDRSGNGPAALQDAVRAMMGKAAQNNRLRQVFSLFENSTPQLYLDIDRVKAQMLGVNIAEVFTSLQTYLGSSYVNDFNLLRTHFRVMAQADAPFRMDPRSREASSPQSPRRHGASRLVHDGQRRFGPVSVPRYNLSRGGARRRCGARFLARPSDRSWNKSRRRRYRKATATSGPNWRSNRSGPATPRCSFSRSRVVFVFLVLAAQYESLTLPLAIILIVPMCLVASISGVILRGQDNNILTQVGFIVLIGLAAKNAILIVEFAKQLEEAGTQSLGRGDGGGAASAAAHFDDVARVHPRRRAASLGRGRRCRVAAGARDGGVRRHDRRHRVRPRVHSGVLCHLPVAGGSLRARAQTLGGAASGRVVSRAFHQRIGLIAGRQSCRPGFSFRGLALFD